MTHSQANQWPEFLVVSEVAAILRVSKMTVYRLLHNGDLESTRVGRSFRVKSPSLRSYIANNPGGTGGPDDGDDDVIGRVAREIASR